MTEEISNPPTPEDNIAYKIIKGAKSAKVVVLENMPITNSFGKMKNSAKRENEKKYALQCIERHQRLQAEEQKIYDTFNSHYKTNRTVDKAVPFIISYQKSKLSHIKKEGKYKKSNYNKRKKTRSGVLWDIAKNNFDETNTVYWTLTYSRSHPTAYDLTACLKNFKQFREHIGRQYQNFQYIATFAQQQNGNWHFHVLCNLISLSERKVTELWKYGKVKKHRLNTIKDISNVTSYLVKNMQSAEECLQSKKGYLCSQNLTRSAVLRSWNEAEAEQCSEAFEQLQGLEKRILYDVEKPCGAVVKLEYPSGTVESFVAKNDMSYSTDTEIVEKINARITAVAVNLPQRTKVAMIATPRNRPKPTKKGKK